MQFFVVTNSSPNRPNPGGLVSHCWIAGKIMTDEGVLGGQAVAIVPVEILVSG